VVIEAPGRTAVVIDDDESIREGCRQALEAGGYWTRTAEDGEQGLQLARELRPRVVIIDLKMPGMSGMEVLRAVLDASPEVTPIVITGYGSTESAIEAMRAGASDYLLKPFDDEALLSAVGRGLQRGRRRGSPAAPRSGGGSPLPPSEAAAPSPTASQAPRVGGPSSGPGAAAARRAPAETAGFLSPAEVAGKLTGISASKCGLRLVPMIVLGALAGVYIGFGAELYTMVVHDLSTHLGVGFAKFVGGSVFSVGLMLVILGGAELFTGNCLIVTGVLARKCSLAGMLRNWSVVYLANFAGSVLLALIMYYSGLWKTAQAGVGAAAVNIAAAKVSMPFWEAFMRGVGCNWLVCLAVWLAVAGKDAVSKIFGVYFPIMAFVASGFEHSVANMYFVPMGLFLKSNAAVAAAAGPAALAPGLTWLGFLTANLLPVTLGNVVGGGLFVAGAYYLVYLRRRGR
jgi:formate/nitrite transporter